MLRRQESWERMMEREMMDDNYEGSGGRVEVQRLESLKNERKGRTVRRQESLEKGTLVVGRSSEGQRSMAQRQESMEKPPKKEEKGMLKVEVPVGKRERVVRRQESMERMAKKMPMDNMGLKRASVVKRYYQLHGKSTNLNI